MRREQIGNATLYQAQCEEVKLQSHLLPTTYAVVTDPPYLPGYRTDYASQGRSRQMATRNFP